MKKIRNQKGFSLVELIVVIVILGILVAIAVPSLIGYINRANVSSDISAASGLQSAVMAYVMSTNQVETDLNHTALYAALTGKDLQDGDEKPDYVAYTEENWPVVKSRTDNKAQMGVAYDPIKKIVIVTTKETGGIEILPNGADHYDVT